MPLSQFSVVRVSGIGDCLEEVLVTWRSSHVLGRAAAFSFDQPWIELARQGAIRQLRGQLMSPVVAEVVGVDERSVPCGCESLLYGGLAGRQGIKPEVGIGQAPSAGPCLKAVEMLVLRKRRSNPTFLLNP